jgi:CDP-diacylglycerol---serine O-phosphatidyltransferase
MTEIENEPPQRRRPVLLSGKSKLMREKLRGKTFLIPSFVTVVGIFCGFLAIISALKGRYDYATKCIALSFVLDGLDGRIARRLNATSAFGREFDSLSDLVAFGVAPALLVYCWAFGQTVDEYGLVVCFLFVVCGATRLARFNIADPAEAKLHFTGLPIPGGAAAIASIVYCFPESVQSLPVVVFLLGYMTLIAILMVSTLPYFSIKHLKLTKGNPALNLLLLSLAAGLTWKYSQQVIIIGSNFYALSGLAGYFQRKRLRAKTEAADTQARPGPSRL